MVERSHIIAEIRRTAKANGGVALGVRRFSSETGIRENDWIGRYWARWGDALREAGFDANQLTTAYDDDFLLSKLAALTRSLGHFPARTELQLAGRTDSKLPTRKTYERFGNKSQMAEKLAVWCEQHEGFDDVVEFCKAIPARQPEVEQVIAEDEEFGWVYLLKSGRFFKIGRTNAVGRRERELAIQLPEKASLVHSIKTDDPNGIEFYWHRRFESRRKNGEWFELSARDVAAFKRRKFM